MYEKLLNDIGVLICELKKNSRFETVQYFQSQRDKIALNDEQSIQIISELTRVRTH